MSSQSNDSKGAVEERKEDCPLAKMSEGESPSAEGSDASEISMPEESDAIACESSSPTLPLAGAQQCLIEQIRGSVNFFGFIYKLYIPYFLGICKL